MHRAIELLASAADRTWIAIETNPEAKGGELRCTAMIREPDGEPIGYGLLITDGEGGRDPLLRVREEPVGVRLPLGCPQRHINKGGPFCLGFGPTSPPTPVDLETARAWWSLLAGYLSLQGRAALTRRWPEPNAWRHGAAAGLQLEIERLERVLPLSVIAAAQAVEASTNTALTGSRMKDRRRPCPCGSRARAKDCHEPALVKLLSARQQMAQAEADFWREWESETCCGTMEGCRLSRDG